MAELDFKLGRSIYLIGLTGNIACGKSTILNLLTARGAFTIDADQIVHRLMQPGGTTYAPILAAFGPTILSDVSEKTTNLVPIDRRKLGAIVFADTVKLRQLEAITHPAVHQEIVRLVQETSAQVVVVDAIKLIENGLDRATDAVWVVTCPPEVQLTRLMARNAFSREEALLRIAAQPPQSDKVARADVVIDNGGSREVTEQQVEAAWQNLLRVKRSVAEPQ